MHALFDRIPMANPSSWLGTHRRVLVATVLFLVAQDARSIDISGRIVSIDGNLPGMIVRLSGTNLVDTSKADGTWRLGDVPSTGTTSMRSSGLSIRSSFLDLTIVGSPIRCEATYATIDGSSMRVAASRLLGEGRHRVRLDSRLFSRGAGALRVRVGSDDYVAKCALGRCGSVSNTRSPSCAAAREASNATSDTLVFRWKKHDRERLLMHTKDTSGLFLYIDTTERLVQNPAITYGTLEDERDGQAYKTVRIGRQTWIAEGLNLYVDSSWWYENKGAEGRYGGRMYSWTTALGLPDTCATRSCLDLTRGRLRGLCPKGWHVPSLEEFDTLMKVAGGPSRSGYTLRAMGGWYDNRNGNDSLGFRLVATGRREQNGVFMAPKMEARWITTDEQDLTVYWAVSSFYSFPVMEHAMTRKAEGFGLRCIQD